METAKAANFPGPSVIPNPKARLLDQVREVIRVKHYSIRTEITYRDWIKRFIFFFMGSAALERWRRLKWSGF